MDKQREDQMTQNDEFRKMEEEIAIKHTDVRSEDLVILKYCRWSLSNDIETALRTTASKHDVIGYNRAVEDCANNIWKMNFINNCWRDAVIKDTCRLKKEV